MKRLAVALALTFSAAALTPNSASAGDWPRGSEWLDRPAFHVQHDTGGPIYTDFVVSTHRPCPPVYRPCPPVYCPPPVTYATTTYYYPAPVYCPPVYTYSVAFDAGCHRGHGSWRR
jgi:hypothetical protein